MLRNLQEYQIILASKSPRRQHLLKELGLKFEIKTVESEDESYPPQLSDEKIVEFLAQKKAANFKQSLAEKELIITADTIVVLNKKVLNKPANYDEAVQMLNQMSGKMHKVITAVCLLQKEKETIFHEVSEVYFKKLDLQEIEFYVEKYKPYDKAGAYGIQEWIGYVGIEKINGSFYNVMGLPVKKLYEKLRNI